jgi:hypothetical protein
MLRRAGAKLNVTNELGMTPLDLIVMMKHFPDRRSLQLKVVSYLLEHGANVNNVDKGGYSAIDHAAVNQDLEIINLLLAHGAKLCRENHILVAKRKPILDLVHQPECYRTLYEALLAEERDANQRKLLHAHSQRLCDEECYYEQIHVALSKRKAKREARQQEQLKALHSEVVNASRLEQLKNDQAAALKARELQRAALGVWRKAEAPSTSSVRTHWQLELKPPHAVTRDMIYEASKDIMHELHQQNNVQQLNAKWKKLTGGGQLEVKWPRSETFALSEGFSGESRNNLFSIVESQSPFAASGMQALQKDVFYMDENDRELQGEDSLDGLLSGLHSRG